MYYSSDWPISAKSEKPKVDGVAAFSRLTALLQGQNLPHLRTLYLPAALKKYDSRLHETLASVYTSLVAICEQRKSKIVYDEPVRLYCDSLVCLEFWRRRVEEIEAEQNGGKKA
ncbi:hypothetical protein JCM8547_007117 [Rhodosporidiobolus lusitaniae]